MAFQTGRYASFRAGRAGVSASCQGSPYRKVPASDKITAHGGIHLRGKAGITLPAAGDIIQRDAAVALHQRQHRCSQRGCFAYNRPVQRHIDNIGIDRRQFRSNPRCRRHTQCVTAKRERFVPRAGAHKIQSRWPDLRSHRLYSASGFVSRFSKNGRCDWRCCFDQSSSKSLPSHPRSQPGPASR